MEEMNTLNTYKTENNEIVFVTEFGEFMKKRTQQVPGAQYFQVTKVSGGWPNKKTLGAWVDSRYMYLGGDVSIGEDTSSVVISS